MYIWNIKQLKEDIIRDNLTEKDRFIYAFIYISLNIAGAEMFLYFPFIIENPNTWDYIGSLSNILIPILGTVFAFIANGGSSGTDFLGRYFAIGFVITIRFIIFLLPFFMMFMYYYLSDFEETEIIPTTYIDIIIGASLYSLLFWRICKHISFVKNT